MGFIFGLMTPLFALLVFVEMYPALKTVRMWNDPAWQRLLLHITTFGVIMNAGMFFLAFRLNKDMVGKGILSACFVYIFVLVIMQITR